MAAQPEIAVSHPNFYYKGGAESVGMCVLEALQDPYDVTLLTMFEPDFAALNSYFGTDVRESKITVQTEGPQSRPLTTAIAWAGNTTMGFDFPHLRIAAFYRRVRSLADEFDLVVSTYNELGDCGNSIQYVHHPLFDRSVLPGRDGNDSTVYAAYDWLCRTVAGVSFSGAPDTRLFANSTWMSKTIKEAYGVEPDTLYPPIDTSGFSNVAWDKKENGFVTLGRLSSDKNIQRNIRIVDGLRERGHDVHLHVAGPPSDASEVRDIRQMAEERPYIKLEGELSREEVTTLLSKHRFGLHGKEYEHFGMVVAEMSLAGMLPFAHDSGGQREILNEQPRLLYESVDDAIEKIHQVLTNPEVQGSLQASLPDVKSKFGRERFKNQFRNAVRSAVKN